MRHINKSQATKANPNQHKQPVYEQHNIASQHINQQTTFTSKATNINQSQKQATNSEIQEITKP